MSQLCDGRLLARLYVEGEQAETAAIGLFNAEPSISFAKGQSPARILRMQVSVPLELCLIDNTCNQGDVLPSENSRNALCQATVNRLSLDLDAASKKVRTIRGIPLSVCKGVPRLSSFGTGERRSFTRGQYPSSLLLYSPSLKCFTKRLR